MRTTRSWEVSIRNATDAVHRTNKRRRAGGYYLDRNDLAESIDEILPSALRHASLEAFEGRHDETELAALLDVNGLKSDALALVCSEN